MADTSVLGTRAYLRRKLPPNVGREATPHDVPVRIDRSSRRCSPSYRPWGAGGRFRRSSQFLLQHPVPVAWQLLDALELLGQHRASRVGDHMLLPSSSRRSVWSPLACLSPRGSASGLGRRSIRCRQRARAWRRFCCWRSGASSRRGPARCPPCRSRSRGAGRRPGSGRRPPGAPAACRWPPSAGNVWSTLPSWRVMAIVAVGAGAQPIGHLVLEGRRPAGAGRRRVGVQHDGP